MYFRNAVAAIVVYDVTDRLTFEKVDDWVKLIRTNAPPDIFIYLVGNKIDLVEEVDVSVIQGKKKSQELCVGGFCEVSAKENVGLDDLMDDIAGKVCILAAVGERAEAKTMVESVTAARTYSNTENNTGSAQDKKKKKCCNIF